MIAAAATEKADASLAPYDGLGRAERYIHRARDRALLALLQRSGFAALAGQRILELGCGEGSFLRTLRHYGADAQRLEGIDIDAARVARARASLAGARLAVADAGSLPFRDHSFDIVFAFTTFSSIVDAVTRHRAASELTHVLRPGGLLVVYDFWTNPFNSRVRPIAARELRRLFAPRPVAIESVTLAPPLVRLLGGRESWCAALERLPFLRTHILAAIINEP